MKRILYILLSVLMALPSMMFADSYKQMWKSVEDAEDKDLPKTQIEWLKKIVDKATVEEDYGQLLKAEIKIVSVNGTISRDSLVPAIVKLEEKAKSLETKDKALAAVYYTVLGDVYRDNVLGTEDYKTKSAEFFKKALADPAFLSECKALDYEPFVVKGNDSKYFTNDLLSLLGYAAEDYQTLHDYYKTSTNRSAALLTGLELLKQKSTQNGQLYLTSLKKSRYIVSLDSLINLYSDLKVCGEAAIARYEFMSKCKDVKVDSRVSYINWALGNWGEWPRMHVLRNALKELTNPKYNASLDNNVIAPETPATLNLLVRNINTLSVKVSKLDVDGDVEFDMSADAVAKMKGKIISGTTKKYVKKYLGQPDYSEIEDSVILDSMPTGVYLVEISTDNKKIEASYRLLHVTDMFVVHQALPNDSMRMAVVSARTGQPIKNVSLVVEFRNAGTKTYMCDGNGETVFSKDKKSIVSVRPYTDTDKACPVLSAYNSFSYYANNESDDILNLFTDRAIYRPGQTVHVSAIVHERKGIETKAAEGRTFTLELRDANSKTVTKKEVTTDAYGTAYADFTLPDNGLTGRFSIRASGKVSGYERFRVEEYKRPTFKVELPDVNQKYHNGDTIVVTGYVKTYADVPVQGAKVKYEVKREKSFWWRYYSSVYIIDDNNDNLLFEGTSVTDADGAFKVEMPMLLPEWDSASGIDEYSFNRMPRFYTIVADVEITDQSGETRTGELRLPLGNKPTAFSCDLPEKTVRDSLKTMRFNLKNFAGNNIDATVNYYIDVPSNAYTAKANQSFEIEWNTPSLLKSGKHTLFAVCENDTIKQDFIVFTMEDTTPCIKTSDWFYVSDKRFPEDGRPVYIQIGSSDENTHVMYTVVSGKNVIASGSEDISNHVYTRKITYEKEFGAGLLLNIAWVRDGKLYSHSATIKQPMPSKELKLEWTTFRDRLVPGQKEEWTLNIKKPDGSPADAQLMATLYDGSLDQIVPFSWNIGLNLVENLPYARWNKGNYGVFKCGNAMPYKTFDVVGLNYNRMDYAINLYSIGTVTRLGGAPLYKAMAKTASLESMAVTADTDALQESVNVSNNLSAEVNASESESKSTAGVQLRENLDETAFFYPVLQTDEKGNVNIKFTLPESITTWNFIGLAHDKDMRNGIITSEAVAKKTIMIQPNMPRFVRVGDLTSIVAKVMNTSDKQVKGTATMILVDPETEKEVLSIKKPFAVDANGTGAVSFDYSPSDEYSLLVCKIIATGKDFSDGEQHYLPVLSDKEMVLNTVPFTQNGPGVKTIDLKNMFSANGKDNRLTVEYTNNPAWLMIQTLPYIGTVRSNNVISLATAYYANSLSSYIMNQSPEIKTVFEQWKNETNDSNNTLMSNLDKNQDLKNLVLEETPWVAAAEKEAEQKRSLANYFDKSTLQTKISSVLNSMVTLQNEDGSWSWWSGMDGSPRLTSTVIELLVRLNKLAGTQTATKSLIDKSMNYLGNKAIEEVNEFKKAEKEGTPYYISTYYALHYLYITALDGRKLSKKEESAAEYLMEFMKKQKKNTSLYSKALMAVVLAQRGERQLALEYLKSLDEYTVSTEEMGRYYDSPRAGYSWIDYRIPTQVAAIEAMTLVDPEGYASVIDDMKRWLLQEKRTQVWDTPINSANAVYAFLNNNTSILAEQEETSLSVNGKILSLPASTAGIGYVKTTVNADKANTFTATKTSEGTSWGAVYAQSLQNVADVEASSSGFTVTREIIPADGKSRSVYATGDRVKVRITIKAERDYDFVQISDKRAACMEPVNQLSGYKWGYYCTPKDYTTNYYFNMMSKGTHVIETEYYIDRTGRYETGTCSVQCAYSPEYTAHTASQTIEVK